MSVSPALSLSCPGALPELPGAELAELPAGLELSEPPELLGESASLPLSADWPGALDELPGPEGALDSPELGDPPPSEEPPAFEGPSSEEPLSELGAFPFPFPASSGLPLPDSAQPSSGLSGPFPFEPGVGALPGDP